MKGLEKGKYTGIATIMLAILAIGSLLPMMAEAEETGYVRGSVYDSATQKLLEGAVVFTDEIQGIWKTDAKGTFLIEDMPYGIYNLTVYKEGYNTSHKEITLNRDTNGTLYDFSLEPALPTEIGVLTGKVYLEAEFHTISGDYTAGDAIVGFESGAQVPTGTIIDIIESTSDTLIGKYTTIVSPGTYNLFCWAYSHNEEHSGGLSVSAGEVVRHDFHLDALDMHNSGLAGNITDETSGVPIPGATVMAYNTATGNTLTTTADSSGFYFFTGPLPGDYIVVATVSSYNANSNTGTVVWGLTTYVDIALNTSNPDIITTTLLGFVFGDGTPLPGATVFTDYYFTQTTNVFGIPGFYLIGDFPGDEIHSVGAAAVGYYPQLDAINVPSGTVERHDFYLQSTGDDNPKYTVVLANVWEDTNSSTPLLNSDVHLWKGSYDHTMNTGSSVNTVMFSLVPGSPGYRIVGSHPGYTYERFVYNPGDIHYTATDTFTVNLTVINFVDIYMNESGGHNKTEIWGHVYFNSMSTPLTGATLMELIPSPGVFDISDSSGYYHQFVSPDTYALQALYPGGMSVSYMDYYTGTSGAAPWSGTVASGMSRHVDFILKLDNRKFSIIAGQVLDYTTHTPITGFEVKAYNSAQLFPATMVDTFGHFMFSPISDFSTDWMVDGYSPVHTVSLVEYDFLSSWTPMTAAGLPITFTHSPMTVMWVNIYVNQSEPPSERTKLWGKVFLDDFGGLEVSGVVVMEHLVSPGIFDVTDTTGTYSKVVTSGLTYELDISYPTAYSIRYYDHQTGITGVGSWSDVVTSVSRRVDFAFKLRTKEYAEILGQVTLESDGSPVPGFSITAENLGGSTYPPQSTGPGGMFEFNPVADLSSDWIIDGSHPGYSVVSVEYHLIGGTTTTATSLPVDFPLSSMDIMWVDISVNQTDICNGTVFGKVYKLYNYDPAAGAQATIYNAATPFTPMDAQTLGTNGLYTFTVPAGIYIVKISLSGYSTESAEVTVVCDEETYHPFYLIPRPIGPWNVVSIKFVMNETGEPLSGSWVEVSGLGRLKTDEAGDIHLKIPGPTNLTINLKSFVVVASNDDNGKEIPTNDDGTVTLEPGRSYTNRVVKFRPGSELATNVKSESPEVSTLGLIGIVAAALVIGGAAGFLARGSRKTDIEE